jgi:hypothetical protein
MRSFLGALALGVLISTTTFGCSSSSPAGGAGGAGASTSLPGVGEKASALIKASSGGTLAATGGSIDVPAGALASDTTLTVEIKAKTAYAGSDAVAVNVYDFGPNGTQFLKPVTMSLDLEGVAVPSGKTAVLAYYDGAAWKPLGDSKVDGGKVTGTTTHFTPFSIVFVNGNQSAGGCGAFAGFTACGGDLTGTWKFTAGCVDVAPDPNLNNCQGASVTGSLDQTGTITFGPGTYSVDDTQSVKLSGIVPKSCLPAGKTCQTAFSGSDTTVTETATECDITFAKQDSSKETGTTTANGGSLTLKKNGGSSTTTIEYCVNGSSFTAKNTDDKGNVFFYTAAKQ